MTTIPGLNTIYGGWRMTPGDVLESLVPWEPSPLLVAATVVSALCYLRGALLLRPDARRQVLFWAGLLSLYGAGHTEFDYYSEHAFFMHRIGHAVLHHDGPFLIALSRPGAVLAAGAPGRLRRLAAALLGNGPVQAMAAALNRPATAVLLFCGLIYLWLLPPVHFIAMLDWRWYRIMNWSVAVNGLMFWNLIFNNYSLGPARLSPATRIIMALAVIPPQIAAGAALSFSARDLYPVYAVCGRVFSGVGPLADQQLGGVILWVTGAMMSILAALVIARREWLK